jgi:alpha-tubulin suppressor-like RCC1 family protein
MRWAGRFALSIALWSATLQGQPTDMQIAAGSSHGVLLKTDGSVWTWGGNAYGQLGREAEDSWAPARVPHLSAIRSVAGGAEFTMALHTDGTVWTWGQNEDGQLGNRDIKDTQKPAPVHGLPRIVAIAAAGNHSLALDSNGNVWEWGAVPIGRSGPAPQQTPNLSRITAIAAGDRHSIALDAGGHVWVWGDHGAEGSSSSGQLAGLSDVTAVAGAYQLTVALKKDGTVWSVGYGAAGQRGNGAVETSSQPVMVTGLSGVKAIAARYMTVMALKSDGTVWNWGSNHYRQLGNPAFRQEDVNKPVRAGTLTGIVAIAAAGSHSVAVSGDGTVWTWGQNDRGALGADPEDLSQSDTPMQPGQQIPPPCRELFACLTALGKQIRICGTQDESDVGKWSGIHYRFGPEHGPPDLMCPADPTNTPPSLFFSEENRGHDSIRSIRFSNGAYTYTVYYGSSGGGVDVKDAKGRKVTGIVCVERPEVYDDYLRTNLPCDPKSAAGCKSPK